MCQSWDRTTKLTVCLSFCILLYQDVSRVISVASQLGVISWWQFWLHSVSTHFRQQSLLRMRCKAGKFCHFVIVLVLLDLFGLFSVCGRLSMTESTYSLISPSEGPSVRLFDSSRQHIQCGHVFPDTCETSEDAYEGVECVEEVHPVCWSEQRN